jgi:hypothetical protein
MNIGKEAGCAKGAPTNKLVNCNVVGTRRARQKIRRMRTEMRVQNDESQRKERRLEGLPEVPRGIQDGNARLVRHQRVAEVRWSRIERRRRSKPGMAKIRSPSDDGSGT